MMAGAGFDRAQSMSGTSCVLASPCGVVFGVVFGVWSQIVHFITVLFVIDLLPTAFDACA